MRAGVKTGEDQEQVTNLCLLPASRVSMMKTEAANCDVGARVATGSQGYWANSCRYAMRWWGLVGLATCCGFPYSVNQRDKPNNP